MKAELEYPLSEIRIAPKSETLPPLRGWSHLNAPNEAELTSSHMAEQNITSGHGVSLKKEETEGQCALLRGEGNMFSYFRNSHEGSGKGGQ